MLYILHIFIRPYSTSIGLRIPRNSRTRGGEDVKELINGKVVFPPPLPNIESFRSLNVQNTF